MTDTMTGPMVEIPVSLLQYIDQECIRANNDTEAAQAFNSALDSAFPDGPPGGCGGPIDMDAVREFDKVGWECPECGKDSPFVNAGRTQVCYCTDCQVSWIWGSNLTDSWKHQTEAEQRADYEAAGIERMRRIED